MLSTNSKNDKEFCLPIVQKLICYTELFIKRTDLNKISNSPFKDLLLPLKERFPEAQKFSVRFLDSKIVLQFWKRRKMPKHRVFSQPLEDEVFKEIEFNFHLS